MLDQSTQQPSTLSEAPSDSASPAPQGEAPRGRRGPKKQPATDFLFALAKEENGKNGVPVLTECFTLESEAILAAFRSGTDYYRLQRCNVPATVKDAAAMFAAAVAEKPFAK
jgi:hypothetical protein